MTTIHKIEERSKAAGLHWFDAATLGYFASIVYPEIYGGEYFISSERDRSAPVRSFGPAWDGERRFSIRRAFPDGSICTVGEFGQYGTKEAAIRAAEKLAAKGGA